MVSKSAGEHFVELTAQQAPDSSNKEKEVKAKFGCQGP